MVVTSRSSLRSSVRPRAENLVSTNTRAKQRVLVEDSAHARDDILSYPKRIANSRSLPNLIHRSQENHRKRPRLLSPPSPSRSRPPRAPLGIHQSAPQHLSIDVTVDKKTDQKNIDDEPRSVKKFRRDERRPVPVATNKTPLQSRDSPDPLSAISCPSRPSRMRQRATTISAVATTIASTTGSAVSPPSRRSSRHTGRSHPVVIADDVENAVTEGSVNGADDAEVGQNKKPVVTTRANAAIEKRSLRSHDGGSRSKSELAMYFPNYEQMISLEPAKQEFLSSDTTVVLLDDLTESPLPPSPVSSPSRTRKQRQSESRESPFGNPLLNLHACEVIELPSPSEPSGADPLSEEGYFKAHRRNERQEKQLRNIERERAQHEKVQLDRLLDELQGHDWLRVMGISGITDTEKKLYEPKRDFFVKEVSALIEKFRVWKEEEKRRKQEREQMLLEAAAATFAKTEAEKEESGDENEESDEAAQAVEEAHPPSSDIQSYGDINDVDAWAARQLLQEARSASRFKRTRLVDGLSVPAPPPAPVPEKPFVSFYAKRYLRDAAIGGHRRGRSRTAFGHIVPDMEEREFEPPDDILTPDVLQALDRKRRRLKRESIG